MRAWLRASFLRARFGRRVLLLFLACAMLPLVIQTTIVLRQMSAEMHRQAVTGLRRTAKATGMSLIAQLNAIEKMSERIAWRAAATLPASIEKRLASLDTGLVHAFIALGAAGDTLSRRHAEEFANLGQALSGASKGKLLFPELRGGTPALAMITTHETSDRTVRVQMLIDAQRFFGSLEAQGWSDGGVETCNLLNGRVLWCSLPQAEWSKLRMTDRAITLDGERYLSATWSGFATVTQPNEHLVTVAFTRTPAALGDSAEFRKSLLLIALITLVLVFLASHVQLRRRLRPLDDLTRAAQRVGARDFGVRVDITSDDEFGAVARSFNEMSGRIASHVTVLSAARGVNDEALRANSVPELLPRLTSHIQGVLPAGCGMSLTVRSDRTLWLRRSLAPGSVEWIDDRVEVGAMTLAPLERGEQVFGRFALPDALPSVRESRGHPRRQRDAVALPLLAERELIGFLVVMLSDGMSAAGTDLEGLRAIAGEIAVALNRVRLVGRLEEFNYGTLTALARAVDAKSPWTAGHSESVTEGAMRLGEVLRLTSDELDLLHRGGLLHDIGKIAVPGHVLDKAGPLTLEEKEAIKSHPEAGARILAPIEAYAPIIPIVLYHHERYDGSGYPRGLAGESIPAHARLVAIIDVYDALVADRPYRRGWAPNRALSHILQGAGKDFDPVMAQAFATIEPSLREWYAARRERQIEPVRSLGSLSLTAA